MVSYAPGQEIVLRLRQQKYRIEVKNRCENGEEARAKHILL